jgi:hypothetical protein
MHSKDGALHAFVARHRTDFGIFNQRNTDNQPAFKVVPDNIAQIPAYPALGAVIIETKEQSWDE